jgi:hypothetical protein
MEIVILRAILAISLHMALYGCQRTNQLEDNEGSSSPSFVAREVANAEINVASKPLNVSPPQNNPFAAKNGRAGIGFDAASSHLVDWAGPTSNQLTSALIEVGGSCSHGGFVWDRFFAAICQVDGNLQLVLIRFDDFSIAARVNLSPAPRETRIFPALPFIVDAQQTIWTITPDYKLLKVNVSMDAQVRIDEAADLKEMNSLRGLTSDDGEVVGLSFDFSGNLWLATSNGALAVLQNNELSIIRLIEPQTRAPEQIGNHVVIAPDNSVYVATTHAIYRLEQSLEKKEPLIIWREVVERGSQIKKGQKTQGTGTGPLLVGADYLAVADNRDVRMDVLVFDRRPKVKTNRRVCDQPIFRLRQSASEAAMVAVGESILVQNTFGYESIDSVKGVASTVPGFARIDLDKSSSSCKTVWNQPLVIPNASPIASLASGLVYAYVKKGAGWYFTAIDFETGKTSFDFRVGGTEAFTAHDGVLALAPNGIPFITVANGVVAIIPSESGAPSLPRGAPLLLDEN